MSATAKLSLAASLACAYLLAVVAAAGAVLGAGLDAAAQAPLAALVEERLGALLMVLFAACGFLFVILRALHARFVLAPARVAEEAAAMLEEPAARLARRGSGELADLVTAVNRIAEQRQRQVADIDARIRSANAATDAERNRFAALIGELAQGVVVCDPEGRVLLYNRQARDLVVSASGQGVAALGLGRSIYGVLDRHLIAYALENLAAHGGRQTHFVAATDAGRLLRVLVAPVPGSGQDEAAAAAPGLAAYLLMLEDATEVFESESARDVLLHELTENTRGPLANLRAAAEMLHDYDDMSPGERQRFVAVVRDEAAALSGRLEVAARDFAALLKSRWPLEEMLGADLLAAAARRIADRCRLPVSLEEVAPDLWLKVDGFSLLQAMTSLVARLHDEYAIRELRLRLTGDGGEAYIDLIWSGAFMSTETVMQWELEPMHAAGEPSPLSVRDVVERCRGEIWFQRERASHRAYFRFLLPVAVAARPGERPLARAIESRPEFFDFDLFKNEAVGAALDDRPLGQFSYTVFDTETTGLDPSAGDEIIQIGAVRIVNRRLLRQECYEQLIDPRRPLPAKAVKVHGISAEMLAGQPPIAAVLPVFRAFVGDSVLVAHNAAFDMRFLELKEAATGVRFDRPVLDTFLLSAVLFPNQESHRLEAIAERLGVSVQGRHTAVGDALVTAEVFLKMLPLLAEKGIHTLRAARAASARTYHARTRY